ncbi:MAG: diaminopimelate epimerase [Bacteroidaceae bacterium]
MKRIAFTKMHGCGNDYIYVDVSKHPIDNPQEASIRWSDRHKGIGADGLVLIDKVDGDDADFSMRIFNADGSEALMCGNASRCIGKYLYEKGLTDKTTIRLLTKSGVKVLELTVSEGVVESVCVDMLEPKISDKLLFCMDEDPEIGVFVSMGNPHYVIFTDNVDKVADMGPRLECHEAFPQRCNIEFAKVNPDGSIRTRVWERGSGITMACGTGACATAVAAAMTGRTGRQTDIIMDGGMLHVEWNENNHVFLSGPAEFVFDGEIYM